jgi:hypothetical protein
MSKQHLQYLDGLCTGKYKIGKYFYARTLQQHERSKQRTGRVQSSSSCRDAASPRTPPRSRKQLSPQASSSSNPSSFDSPASETSGVSSKSLSSLSRDTTRVAELLRNHVLAIYHVLHQGWSAASYTSCLHLSRLQGASLLDSHDSETFFAQVLPVFRQRLGQSFKDRLAGSSFFALSCDEKGPHLVIMITFIDVSQKAVVTNVLGYVPLPGLEASDITRCILSVCNEHGLDLKKSLVAFTADGASVMGTRRAFGLPGSNVAKFLQDECERRLLVVHCAAHRL